MQDSEDMAVPAQKGKPGGGGGYVLKGKKYGIRLHREQSITPSTLNYRYTPVLQQRTPRIYGYRLDTYRSNLVL